MRKPQLVKAEGLPDRVTIYEVGPRDGLQNESAIVDVAVKAEFISWSCRRGSARRSWCRTSAASTVHSRPGSGRKKKKKVAIFASATETFAAKNLNSTLDDQFAMFTPTIQRALAEGLAVRGYVSMCYGDPWEGDVPIDQVVKVGARLADLGCHELSLGDTIGVATPGQVGALIGAFGAAGVGVDKLAVHFHDTYGQALANTLTALREGVTTVDSSAGGLGGCPYAESATGNLATEDLLWQLDGLGIETGVDLEKLVTTSTWMATQLGKPSPSRVVQALAG